MNALLDELDRRGHRTPRRDPRALYRAAVTDADASVVTDLRASAETAGRGRSPQRVGLAALVACVALIALGLVWIGRDRDDAPVATDVFPAADVRFGPLTPPDGYELSTVRVAMYGPPPEVRVMTTVYAPDAQAASSLTILVRRGASFTPDIMVPGNAATEVIGGHEVRIAGDESQLGAAIAAWDRSDGSRVFVIGRGVTTDDVRRAIPDLVVGSDDLATPAVLPDGFVAQFKGDGTGSLFAVTGSETVNLQYAPTDGTERQVSVESVPGATFEPLALRWLDPSVEAVVLPDGASAFRASEGRSWVKVLPEGLAVVHTYQLEPGTDVGRLVAQVRSLTPSEWDDVVGDAEVVVGLQSNEAVGTRPP